MAKSRLESNPVEPELLAARPKESKRETEFRSLADVLRSAPTRESKKPQAPKQATWRQRFLGLLPFLILEAIAVFLLVFQPTWFGLRYEITSFGFHFLATIALSVSLYPWLPTAYRESPWLTGSLVFGVSIALPVFGPACILSILKLLNKVSVCKSEAQIQSESDWIVGSQAPDVEAVDYTKTPDAAGSMLQVMVGADPISRRNLVLATKRLPNSQAIPVLRAGLQDTDEETKLYSQALLSQMVERYEQSIAELKARVEEEEPSSESFRALAELYCEMVELDLVTDSQLQRFYLIQAIDLMQRIVELEPENEEALAVLGRYHLKVNQPREALEAAEQLRKLGAPNEMIEPIEVEGWYQLRDWDEFRERLRTCVIHPFCDPELQHLGEFWIREAVSRSERNHPEMARPTDF